jgi:hypothetical protein
LSRSSSMLGIPLLNFSIEPSTSKSNPKSSLIELLEVCYFPA